MGTAAQDPLKKRKASHSGPPSPPTVKTKKSAPSVRGEDAVRKHVFTSFVASLTPFFESSRLTGSSSTDTPQSSSSASSSLSSSSPSVTGRVNDYSRALEEVMFESFAETPAGKSDVKIAGKAYKDRFRTLSFNLRNSGNEELRSRIVSGELSPHMLAVVPSEQLANASIRALTEKAREESLRQSVLKAQQQGGPLRKITHKGEVDIERDNVGPLNESFSRTPRARSPVGTVTEETTDRPKLAARETLPSNSKSGDDETSHEAPSHGSIPARSSSSEDLGTTGRQRQPSGADKSVHDSAANRVSSFDFSNVWQAENKDATPEEGKMSDGEAEDKEDPDHEAREDPEDQASYEPTKASDDFIDTFLQGIGSTATTKAGADALDADVPAKTTEDVKPTQERSTTPTDQPPPAEAVEFWRGAICMPEEATISGTARQIAGPRFDATPHIVESFFPRKATVLEGRLPSKVAIDYLVQSQNASRTELVVFALEQSFEPEALKMAPPPSPSSEGALDASFRQLLNYLSRRERYGVLLPSKDARGRMIKDFYIAPLPRDAHIPPWLEMAGCLPLLGQERSREKDMMLLVAVVFKGTIGKPAPRPATSTAGQAGEGQPTADLSQLLGSGGSSSLQDLLKAVGGGSPPRNDTQRPETSASVNQQQQRQEQQNNVATVLGALNAPPATAEAQSAAAALNNIPQEDVTSLLNRNPDLISQLLSTFGRGDVQTGAPLARPPPPGPPPRPPPGTQGMMPGPPPGPPPAPPAGLYGAHGHPAHQWRPGPGHY